MVIKCAYCSNEIKKSYAQCAQCNVQYHAMCVHPTFSLRGKCAIPGCSSKSVDFLHPQKEIPSHIGLLFGVGDSLRYYDFKSKKAEPLLATPGTIFSLAFFKGNLWIAHGNSIGTLDSVHKHMHGRGSSFLQPIGQTLYACIAGLLWDAEKEMRISHREHFPGNILFLFEHKDTVLALVEAPGKKHAFFHVRQKNDLLSLCAEYRKHPAEHSYRAEAVSIDGSIISTLHLHCLDKDGKVGRETHLYNAGRYETVAVANGLIYAGGYDTHAIHVFTPSLDPVKTIAVDGSISALFPVTQDQMDIAMVAIEEYRRIRMLPPSQ